MQCLMSPEELHLLGLTSRSGSQGVLSEQMMPPKHTATCLGQNLNLVASAAVEAAEAAGEWSAGPAKNCSGSEPELPPTPTDLLLLARARASNPGMTPQTHCWPRIVRQVSIVHTSALQILVNS
eukprot:2048652-Amphidinium_carterae.1